MDGWIIMNDYECDDVLMNKRNDRMNKWNETRKQIVSFITWNINASPELQKVIPHSLWKSDGQLCADV